MWPVWINKKENPARFEDGTDVDVCRLPGMFTFRYVDYALVP